ncbi:50S ribosomal protein L18 [Aciditerrimonas ferrireducens]|jgi:large subunit ribosomal protein L18|nr:50S ribosomal protein L18 [Aciditerrimonas ferrireducens]MCK4176122.1 50S ribosomal protein L18 [Aciditerrimonas ferrireducens]
MSLTAKHKRELRQRRHQRVRRRVQGTSTRPRLAVFRSARHISAQVIDDSAGRTLAAASTVEPALRDKPGGNVAAAREVGRLVAERARQAGVATVVFDRGGYRFHGRVAALAEAAREAGLEF